MHEGKKKELEKEQNWNFHVQFSWLWEEFMELLGIYFLL